MGSIGSDAVPDPDMGGPGEHLPLIKSAADCDCGKQSTSDMGTSYHLNA